MPQYRVTFKDGSTKELEAHTADQAKQKAKQEAQRESGANERRDPRVAVASVTDLAAESESRDRR